MELIDAIKTLREHQHFTEKNRFHSGRDMRIASAIHVVLNTLETYMEFEIDRRRRDERR